MYLDPTPGARGFLAPSIYTLEHAPFPQQLVSSLLSSRVPLVSRYSDPRLSSSNLTTQPIPSSLCDLHTIVVNLDHRVVYKRGAQHQNNTGPSISSTPDRPRPSTPHKSIKPLDRQLACADTMSHHMLSPPPGLPDAPHSGMSGDLSGIHRSQNDLSSLLDHYLRVDTERQNFLQVCVCIQSDAESFVFECAFTIISCFPHPNHTTSHKLSSANLSIRHSLWLRRSTFTRREFLIWSLTLMTKRCREVDTSSRQLS